MNPYCGENDSDSFEFPLFSKTIWRMRQMFPLLMKFRVFGEYIKHLYLVENHQLQVESAQINNIHKRFFQPFIKILFEIYVVKSSHFEYILQEQ